MAFIAAAAFATGTRRRLREIGLMGANGASAAHIRTTLISEGVLIGLGGGLAGSVLAFVLVVGGRPLLQEFVTRRINEFPFSPLDVLGPIVVAVVASSVAAWLPARTASTVPTLTALQGRMPVKAPKTWVTPLGLTIAAFGTLLFAVGLAGFDARATAVSVIGVVAMLGGVAMLAGPIVAWVSRRAERFPVTSRIVLRDSGRQRTRAAAAVAATMVIVVAPIVALAALKQTEASERIFGLGPDNLQVLVTGVYDGRDGLTELGPEVVSAVRAAVPEAKSAVFDSLDVPIVFPAELAADPDDLLATSYYNRSPFRMAVASEELLALLDDDELRVALERDGVALIGVESRTTRIEIDGTVTTIDEVPLGVQRRSFPRVVVTPEKAGDYDEFSARTTMLVEFEQSWSDRMNLFKDPGQPLYVLTVDGNSLQMHGTSHPDISPAALITLVFLATLVVVLIVVATVTSLSAAESDSDLLTVVAVGATNSVRRRYLGLQSGLHTLIGCVLAAPLTLLLLHTFYNSAQSGDRRLGNFGVYDASQLIVPWEGLATLVIGLPLVVGVITAAVVRSAPLTPLRRPT